MDESLFYDTGYEMPGDSWSWDMGEVGEEIDKIAKQLGVDRDLYYDELRDIVENATYGGHLVIYFLGDIADQIYNNIDHKTIFFKEPNVAVIDINGGSGFDMLLKDVTIKLPYQRNHLHKDTDTPYPYASEVCGMSHNWCEDTKVALDTELISNKDLNGSMNSILDLDTEYQKTYNEGKCTFGDMKFTRHKNVFYINEFPCGNKCKDCHTFWID